MTLMLHQRWMFKDIKIYGKSLYQRVGRINSEPALFVLLFFFNLHHLTYQEYCIEFVPLIYRERFHFERLKRMQKI